jgi:hypothetical protein
MLTPVGVLGFALLALGGYALYASGVIGKAVTEAKGFFSGLMSDVGEAMGGISAALANGNIAAAAKVLWSLILLEFERGKFAIDAIWQQGSTFFLEVWSSASATAAGYLIDSFYGVQVTWLKTIGFLSDAWDEMAFDMTKVMSAGMLAALEMAINLRAALGGWGEDVRKLAIAAARTAVVTNVRQARTDRDDNVKRMGVERKKALQEVNADWAATKSENDAMNAAAMNKLEQDKADALAVRQKAVDDMRKEFGKANQAAMAKTQTAGGKGSGLPGFGDITDKKNSVLGTFNSFAAGLIGGPNQVLESMNAKLAKIVTNTKPASGGQAGPVFGP